MDEVIINQTQGLLGGGGAVVRTINSAGKARLLDSISVISADASRSGITDGELLIALGRGRPELDPFAIFCKVHGNLTHFMGPTLSLIVYTAGALSLFKLLADFTGTAGDWLVGVVEKYWPFFAAGAGLAGGAFLLFRDESPANGKEREFSIRRAVVSSISRFVLGFFPAPIAGVIDGLSDEIKTLLEGQGAGSSSAQSLSQSGGSLSGFFGRSQVS